MVIHSCTGIQQILISIVAIGPSIISYLGLLQKEPEKRLGSGESDGAELRTHAW